MRSACTARTDRREGGVRRGNKNSKSVVEMGRALVDRVCRLLRGEAPGHSTTRDKSSRGAQMAKGQGERKEVRCRGGEMGDQAAVVVGETEGGLMTPIG